MFKLEDETDRQAACSTHEKGRNAHIILVLKPAGNKHLGDLGIHERVILK